jgi:hypothetical protein
MATSRVQELITFITKETRPSRRSADLGPVPPRSKAEKPADPLAAYKISQDAKKKAEAEYRSDSIVEQVRAKLPQTTPRSNEVPM